MRNYRIPVPILPNVWRWRTNRVSYPRIADTVSGVTQTYYTKGEFEMERKVNYATMVSTGEQPDVAIHVTGFCEDDGIQFHSSVSGQYRDIVCAIEDTVRGVGRQFKDDSEALAKFYVINAMHGIIEGVGAETFKKAFIDMLKGGDN